MTETSLTCIICPMGCPITVRLEGDSVIKITGNTCKRGAAYAESEVCRPVRTLTTTMRCENGQMLSVKTRQPIPRQHLADCMRLINAHTVPLPVSVGDVLLKDVFGSDIVATENKSALAAAGALPMGLIH